MADNDRKNLLCRPILTLTFNPDEILENHFDKTVEMLDTDIMYHIYHGNMSCIYILSETRARELMDNDDEENRSYLFHIIPNTYFCKCIGNVL